MTLSQLRAFALVARLGSMTAAAAVLGISEPAVSSAIAALRLDLQDPLLIRGGRGMVLTPGGRRLAAHADEIVGLADLARREVAAARGEGDALRVAVTAACAEHAAAALVEAFLRRSPWTRVELLTERADRIGPLLADHSVDLALGVRPTGADLEVVPFLRYQRVPVGSARWWTTAPVGMGALLDAHWVAGPDGVESASEEQRWLVAHDPAPRPELRSSEADALEAVRHGPAIMLALAHVVREDVQAGRLVRLPLTGTPVAGLWCATAPGRGRACAGARALQRFATTPDATAAMVGIPRPRHASAVRVELWR